MQHAARYQDLVYDVGMHKGEDTDYYLKKGFRVIGFEADPNLAEHCRSRFSDEIENGRLILVNGAIVELQGEQTKGKTVKFYRNKETSIWGTVVDSWACRNELLRTRNEIIDVPAVDFSEYLKKYGMPYYMKIDIEGNDKVCLRSMLEFEQRPDYVSMESEKVSFMRLEEELNLFISLGYTRFKAVQQENIAKRTVPKLSKEGCYVGYVFEDESSGLFGTDIPYKWKDYNEIRMEYKIIFILYNLFGDYGILNRYFVGKVLKRVLSLLLRRPIPGWYDTHAKHSSIV